METDAELRSERTALAMADRNIRDGEDRILRQQAMVSTLAIRGLDTDGAERLLQLLGETMVSWKQQRSLIVQRIVYLEARSTAK